MIGDETYEISLAMAKEPELKTFPFVMIYDFAGLDPMTRHPLERIGVYYWNLLWSRNYRLKRKPPYDLGLFVGMPDDVPDKPFGFLLPNRREYARAMYEFIGYVFSFDPAAYSNRAEIKRSLGYTSDPLVIASIGGTAIGKELLELCAQAHGIVRSRVPSLHTILVTGPRVSAASLNVPGNQNIEVTEFVPNLYEHFAACDLAIVQGGATSTLELTALRRPFLYFPIEGHSEQARRIPLPSETGHRGHASCMHPLITITSGFPSPRPTGHRHMWRTVSKWCAGSRLPCLHSPCLRLWEMNVSPLKI